jgi:hypothetical protein
LNGVRLFGHYQNGYVTHDLDRAMEVIAERCGVTDLDVFDIDVPVTTREGERRLGMRLATGWLGGTNIEIMQPVSGHVEPLTAMLPDDPADPIPRFHHIAMRRDDLDQMRAEIAASGLALAYAGEPPGMVFAYLDARESLGHFIELVWKAPGGWEKIGWPQGKSSI